MRSAGATAMLEAVEIEIQHGNRADAHQRFVQPVMEKHAVGQPRQRIVPSEEGDLGLGLLPLGDVFVAGQPAAAMQRTVGDAHHLSARQLLLERNRLARADQRHSDRMEVFGIAAVEVARLHRQLEEFPKGQPRPQCILLYGSSRSGRIGAGLTMGVVHRLQFCSRPWYARKA